MMDLEICERSSGYWIVNDSGVVDNKITKEQPYVYIEEAQKVLKSLRHAYVYGRKDKT